MPAGTTKPIEDTVAKVDDDIAVGSDIEFQRKWWRFTSFIWPFFTLIILADLLGCFGRGYFANASVQSSDGTTDVEYERIERFSTPSILRIAFSQAAIQNGKIQLWVSDDLVKPLGNQRVIPQPVTSILQNNGILYTFAAANPPASVEFALEPAAPGIFPLKIQVPGHQPVQIRIYVMP